MSIKPAYENLTASTVWLAGILLLLCLLVLCLVAIFVARLRWNRRRLPIYYASKDACSSNYRQQYLVRLSYERDPRTCGHKDDCQVWAELLYDENKSIIIVPLYINRVRVHSVMCSSLVVTIFVYGNDIDLSVQQATNFNGIGSHHQVSIRHSKCTCNGQLRKILLSGGHLGARR